MGKTKLTENVLCKVVVISLEDLKSRKLNNDENTHTHVWKRVSTKFD